MDEKQNEAVEQQNNNSSNAPSPQIPQEVIEKEKDKQIHQSIDEEQQQHDDNKEQQQHDDDKEEDSLIRSSNKRQKKVLLASKSSSSSIDERNPLLDSEDIAKKQFTAFDVLANKYYKNFMQYKNAHILNSRIERYERNTYTTNTLFYLLFVFSAGYIIHFLLRPKLRNKSMTTYKICALICFAMIPLIFQALVHPGIGLNYPVASQLLGVRFLFVLVLASWFLYTYAQLSLIEEFVKHGENPVITRIYTKTKSSNWYSFRTACSILYLIIGSILSAWILIHNVIAWFMFLKMSKSYRASQRNVMSTEMDSIKIEKGKGKRLKSHRKGFDNVPSQSASQTKGSSVDLQEIEVGSQGAEALRDL